VDIPVIGKLNKRGTIRRWQDVPDAVTFGIEQTFDAGQEVWCGIEPVGSAIFWGTAQVENGVTHRAIVRRSSTVTETIITGEHVLESEGLRYRIKRASDLNGAGRFVVLECEALGAINGA